MFKTSHFLAAVLISSSGVVQAADAAEDKVGDQTRQWTELQVSGSAASPVQRPLAGDIAERVFQRYADSYSHPIPEQLDREGFVSEGGD